MQLYLVVVLEEGLYNGLLCWALSQTSVQLSSVPGGERGNGETGLSGSTYYCKLLEISAQYIYWRISHRALDGRKYDVSEKMNHYRSKRNTY